MKRLLLSSIALAGFVLLIGVQLGRLEAVLSRRGELRRETVLARIGAEPLSGATHPGPTPPARDERLEEAIRQAPRVMGGVPLLFTEQLFADYPQLEADFLTAKKGQLRLKYGAFFAREGLLPQQVERYLEISLEGERMWIAQSKAAAARGVDLSDPAIKAMAQESAERRKRQIEELLGPEQRARLDQYHDEWPVRSALMPVAKIAALGVHPLTADQFDRLVARTAKTGAFDNGRPLQSLKLLSRASGSATEVLTPEQQEVFELLVEARQAAFVRALSRAVK